MRRGARADRRGFGATITPTERARRTLLALSTVLFAETEFLLDGTGTVLAIYDVKDSTRTHVVTQPDTAKQVLPPAMHADFGGKNCYAFTLNTQFYESNRASSTFIYAHDGNPGVCSFAKVGASSFTGFAPLGLGTASLASAAAGPGFSLFHQNAGGWRVVVSDGAAYTISNVAAGGVPTGQSRLIANLATAATPDLTIYRNGASVATANAGGALSSGAPVTSARFGAVPGSNGFIQRTQVFGYAPFLTTDQVAQLDQLLQAA